MITGFNTDIKHAERVFHIQTEDRGLGNPVVESLVYVGGEILLSKKSPYKEHIKGDRVDEKVVRQIMDLQHRRIIEAIRRGRFDGAMPGEFSGEPLADEPPVREEPGPQVSAAAAAAAAAILSSGSGPIARPAAAPRPQPRQPSGAVGRAPQAAPPARGSSGERSLDQVIIDYLASEAAAEHLELTVVKGGELESGETVALSILAATSQTGKPVAGASVSIRVVSTVGPARVLFRGVTGNDGLVKTSCKLPDIGSANAALIVAASSPVGNNEVKQLIRKKV